MRLVRTRQFKEAIPLLRQLLHETYVTDFEYDDWLRGLADSEMALNNPLPAGYIYLYLHYFGLAEKAFAKAESPVHQAICLECQGHHQRAAQIFEAERKYARAAINYENVANWAKALDLWKRVAEYIDPTSEPYPYACALLNMVYAHRQLNGPEEERRLWLRRAVTELEQLADLHEERGQLDEAFDCYHILIQIGLEQRAFENLSEGYINCIRILRERGRMLTALRYYAGIGGTASQWGEHHAVATLYREAAEAVQRAGMLYANYYLQLAGNAWSMVARTNIDVAAPPELTENAVLAALDCFNQLDDATNIQLCYKTLSDLPLEEGRVARYARLWKRSMKETREPAKISPPSRLLQKPPLIRPLWRNDLLDWEGGGEHITMLGKVVWDLNFHDTVRRKSLTLVLFYLDESDRRSPSNKVLAEVAKTFAHMRPKVAYKGLKELLSEPSSTVRIEALKSAGQMGHPLGLELVELGLADHDAQVQNAATAAITSHTYPTAFDSVKRLYETSPLTPVKVAAITAMGQMRSFESAEYLFRILVGEPASELVQTTRSSLSTILTDEWRPIFAARLSLEGPQTRERLRGIL